jgi:hypothetical protein
MKARLLLLALLAGSAHASTLGIATSTEGYAYWETFASTTSGGVVTVTDAGPTTFDTADFSATLSAAMSGSTPGGGDRIYAGTGMTGNPFNVTLDGVANASISTLTLQLKFTGPTSQSGTFEQNIDAATTHFSIEADPLWGAASQTLVGYSDEGGSTKFFIFAWTWTDLDVEATDTFEIGITSAPGHVSLDAVRLDAGTVSAVPEPASFAALAGLATLGAAALRRRRRA